jgi:hypothetical protein
MLLQYQERSKMNEQSIEVILRRYLLADLPEAEREKVEERLFSDETLAAELARAEADLIDDYALDALPSRYSELFKQNFILSDERRKNLLFAKAVDAYLEQEISDPVEPRHRSWWKGFLLFLKSHKNWTTAAAAAVVLLLFLTPSVLRLLRFEFASIGTQREFMQLRIAELNRKPPSSERGVEVSLQPSILRGSGELTQVQIAQEVRVVNLTFVLTSSHYNKYSVTARTVEGDELFTITDLSPNPNGTSVFLRVPAEFLPSNDFQFEVKGIAANGGSASVGSYNLRVLQ